MIYVLVGHRTDFGRYCRDRGLRPGRDAQMIACMDHVQGRELSAERLIRLERFWLNPEADRLREYIQLRHGIDVDGLEITPVLLLR